MEYEVKKCSVISGAPDSDIEFIKINGNFCR